MATPSEWAGPPVSPTLQMWISFGHTAYSNEHVLNNSKTIYIYQTLCKVSFRLVNKLNPINQSMLYKLQLKYIFTIVLLF